MPEVTECGCSVKVSLGFRAGEGASPFLCSVSTLHDLCRGYTASVTDSRAQEAKNEKISVDSVALRVLRVLFIPIIV